MPTHQDFPVENAYLQDVYDYLRQYHAEVTGQKKDIDDLVTYSLQHYNSDNPEQFVELLLNTHNQDALLKKVAETKYALNKPYFARVDFIPDNPLGSTRHYIGKMTLMRDLDILITDWRAPVSSLYYEGRIGRAAYDCPDGLIEGEITLKRQYTIEKNRLDSITDIDITTNDDFLQAALGASKDRRLKDIVTTIQAEQNRVIRAALFTPLIVQGVAGGGKTTIALHRIAYLLYAYEQKLKPHQVMIMAPNRFFLSYISDVLPDLGVERVQQTTFEDFAAASISLNRKTWKVNSAAQMMADKVNGVAEPEALEAAALKSELRFMTLMERYSDYIEKHSTPSENFTLEGYELFTHEAIRDLFLREYAYLPVAKRAAEIRKHLTNTLRKEKPLIIEAIELECDRRREEIKRQMEDGTERRALIIALCDDRDERIKRIKNKSKVLIGQYMRAFKIPGALEQYRALFEQPGRLNEMAQGLFTSEECRIIAERTRRTLAGRALDTEDLPPLLVIQMMIFGLEDEVDLKHIVIDEAQDFSLFQFAVLKKLTKNASFSILGDMHQGIYAYKSAQQWEDVLERVFPGASYLTLEQSYRTTMEIMEAANQVIQKLYNGEAPSIPLAKPVIRRGGAVQAWKVPDYKTCAAAIDKKIIACQQEGYQSIAIIGKTLQECEQLRKLLKTKPPLITGREEEYTGGLLLLPSYLVKGLEFDAVIAANVSQTMYREEALDIKLLYIAMTRALHELTLFSIGEPSTLTSVSFRALVP